MTRLPIVQAPADEPVVPVQCIRTGELERALATLSEQDRRFAAAQGFKAKAGALVLLPDRDGGIGRVLFGLGAADAPDRTPLLPGRLAQELPDGLYRLEGEGFDPVLASLAFALGAYRFERYRKPKEGKARLLLPQAADGEEITRIAESVQFARDLINIPANDLGPAELAAAGREMAEGYGASVSIVSGEALEKGYPMIAAVGAASERPPLLLDFAWGDERHPKVTLVGKGVAFDTGGLDIKGASGMLLMKKDMGGAANVLALARMIMDAGLKVRLRVLVAAVENAISGSAFRPGDILRSRKGLTVEIGNTDAEGRLILADALALADEEAPELVVSMATLTGAARVALGPDLPPFYCDDEGFSADLARSAAAVHDPLWRMPFWRPYDSWLASKTADLGNISHNSHAGSIVAALFLDRFVEKAKTYAHFDIFAWNPSARPYGPEGGEAQAIRALYHLLRARHS
ncbi:leucyl aminopeptidase family protein [Propylenella binzhouense]|uniref:Leucyl aminopeptidase family protein n=1 Tax=Propylenella binzhouense TaxID=2555902 RepID=A0A964WU45_9HYPH|nr:leucyl aminopeptidase family protein [Propylenella binzhouense]MYZ48666.1 leucyl aminopeptidase family protein [Propylenella binzhouense]